MPVTGRRQNKYSENAAESRPAPLRRGSLCWAKIHNCVSIEQHSTVLLKGT